MTKDIEKSKDDAVQKPSAAKCIHRIQDILSTARATAVQTVNAAMVAAYWEIGREIVQEEQRGKKRAGYGKKLLKDLSRKLTLEFGRGFGERNLRFIRQFYLAYEDRAPSIRYTACTKLHSASESSKIRYTACTKSTVESSHVLPVELSWSHFRVLMRVKNVEARNFYEVECIKASWSVRELGRQINSFLFERLSKSKDKEGVLKLARDGHQVQTATDLIKDPYVLEFVGLPDSARWTESDLEQALIDRLQKFILELGRDLYLVARQKRITVGRKHYYIDLVFYHRVLRCFLLIDLKLGELTHQDIGQMQFYTGYYEQEEIREDEEPPIGLILCADKDEAMVKYTLSKSASQIFASRYQLHLPSEEELAAELRREREALEHQVHDEDEDEDAK